MEMFHLFEAFLSTIVDYVESQEATWRHNDSVVPSATISPGIPSEDLTVWFFYFGHDVGDDNGEITRAFHSSRYLIFFVSPSSQRKVMRPQPHACYIGGCSFPYSTLRFKTSLMST
jgi:hypothetical protein